MRQGVFMISLDFELHWGGFEKWPLTRYEEYFLNTRIIIPQILEIFARYQIHVTWATVGMLFHKTKTELLKNAPRLKPTYQIAELSAYHYIDNVGIGNNESEDAFHFAPTLIEKIINTPYQEIGSHTFSHYYCNEKGQTTEQFRDDLKAAQRAASIFDIQLRSLVFPRNQFNDDYLKICKEEGISAVRSNPRDWFWNIQSTQNESVWKRLNRGLDAYFSIGRNNTYPVASLMPREDAPVCIPASRLLRPYNPRELFLNTLKISRIKEEMSRAALQGELYHLWWHPHNFGHYPLQSMNGLKQIAEHYAYCRREWKMHSLNMGELASSILYA